jgi:hypothetical protein
MEKNNNENYRYERKIFITSLSKYEVEQIIKMHPSLFIKAFPERYVNNIYFDTHNYNNLLDNIEGNPDRIKIRVRWYGDLFGLIEKPVLEIKIKKGFLGKKISIPLKPFMLNKHANISEIIDSAHISDNSIIKDLKLLSPTLLNRYARKYYQSSNKKYRITLDSQQSFYSISKVSNAFLNRYTEDVSVILELKYDKEHDQGANYIISMFPFRITKSSKYVNGLQKILPTGIY